MKGQKVQRRKSRGSAISEMGPALFILLMMIFIPMLDVLGIAASYCSCMWLNMAQTKEACVVPSADAMSAGGQVQKGVVDNWLNNGVGKFVKTTAYPQTTVTYHAGQEDPNTHIKDKFVRVDTKITCNPFLTIPFWFPVPGLSAPMTFTLSSDAQMENPDNAG